MPASSVSAVATSALAARYAAVRDRTVALTEPLSAEDCCVQSMADASPAKWHLGHTTWFFETFILERHEDRFKPYFDAFRILFNSYYNAIGEKHPRPQRGLLTRPSLSHVLDYRRNVDARMERLLSHATPAAVRELTVLGMNHEQQHQELILTDVKHLFSLNPLRPVYLDTAATASGAPAVLAWHDFEGGVASIGYSGEGFCYDNETPRHQVLLAPYQLASRLVTNGEYGNFIAAGGYEDPRFWLSDGWDWRGAQKRRRPCYWREGAAGEEEEFTLGGVMPLDPHRPVVHVSYYEADAFARWAGARLPTEAEWENAASQQPIRGHFSDSRQFHPTAATTTGLAQLYGDAWEWTQSSYAPYPGFRPADGAVGEYNGKFMVNQYVLRGGSCATPADHMRASYRNFFPAGACWQFSGIRLARDLARSS